MPDALTILRTMRAAVADVEPRQFHMAEWFNRKRDCGCIIGTALYRQPRLAHDIHLALRFEGNVALVTDLWGNTLDTIEGDHWDWDAIGRVVGVSGEDAEYLFDSNSYPDDAYKGKAGKREALRRLDETIAKYRPAAVAEPVHA